MKHKSKKAAAAALIFALLLCTFSASASVTEPLAKEEVVYASLGADGSVSGVYVVNSFELDDDTVITDHGQYSSVVNLTNGNEINYSSGTISVEAEKGMFWYQGNMDDAELPWNISIEYWFDGEKTEDPAGKTGAMELKILTSRNENASGTFFEDYTLQITVTLDTAICSHIEAPSGTAAASGNDKLINFVGMAGSEGEFIVTADVVDFEMASITIAGVKMDMGSYLEGFDLSAVTEEFSSQFAQLSDGIAQLDDGAGQLSQGLAAYAQGAAEYSDGAAEFSSGVDQLAGGADELAEGIKQVNGGAKQLADSAADISDGMSQLSQGLDLLGQNGSALADGAWTMVESTFAAVNAELSEYAAAYNVEFSLTPDNYTGILSTFKTAMPTMSEQIDQVQAQLDGVIQFYNGIKAYTDGVSEAAAGAAQLSGGMSQYSAGVSTFADGTAQLSDGIDELTGGAAQLSDGAAQLADGAKQLSDGARQLSGGAAEYKEGIAMMRESTDGLDKTIENSISDVTSDLLPQSGEVCSFTSSENTDVESVQFVMRTDAVVMEDAPATAEDAQPMTFWQKLLALFGL